MADILTTYDYKELARRRVPRMFFDYADSGSWTQSTYRRNSRDFSEILLRQRVAIDIGNRSLETNMAAERVAMPIALAPTGLAGMQHANGEILAARAAEEFSVPFTLSTMSICSIEDVAEATKKPFWFQLYVMRDRDFAASLLDRALAVGCSAIVLTLDLQVLGQRHKDIRNGLSAPPRMTLSNIAQMAVRPLWCLQMLGAKRKTFGNIVGHAKGVSDLSSLSSWIEEQFNPHFSWPDIEWIRQHWSGKLILKGLMDPLDASRAVDAGADAIIVSNHGGRQLDGAPSSISALPEIVDAVGDQVEVHFDGGIMSGQDVFRALCLGAKATYVGRAYLYGLGAAGQAGVARALAILQKELDLTMALCGERRIQDVGRHNIVSHPFDNRRE